MENGEQKKMSIRAVNPYTYIAFFDNRPQLARWMVGCVYVPSTAMSFRDGTPNLLSLAKDVKLGFYTVPIRNRTPGRRVAVHYTTTAPRKLHTKLARDNRMSRVGLLYFGPEF